MSRKQTYFYWLRLMKDFFQRKEIKKIRMSELGDKKTIIYQELLLEAMNNNGHISINCEDEDLYTELAIAVNEDKSDIEDTLKLLSKYGLAEIDGTSIYLPETEDLVGSERYDKEYQHNYYQRNKSRNKSLNSSTSELNSSTFSRENIREERVDQNLSGVYWQ